MSTLRDINSLDDDMFTRDGYPYYVHETLMKSKFRDHAMVFSFWLDSWDKETNANFIPIVEDKIMLLRESAIDLLWPKYKDKSSSGEIIDHYSLMPRNDWFARIFVYRKVN